jgi:quercetin dioxygenase-like cupin family protein
MQIARGRKQGTPSQVRTETFTGRVWADTVLEAPELSVYAVFFEPRARTHWHRHAAGQVLVVSHGRGLIQARDGTGGVLTPGDVVHIPAGEEHWHGGSPDCYLLHHAISIGKTEWLEAVTDEEYEDAERFL